MILLQFHHCDCEMCEWLNFGTFFKFACIVRIYAWFFVHCRNHHSDNHANHVIIVYWNMKQQRLWYHLFHQKLTLISWKCQHFEGFFGIGHTRSFLNNNFCCWQSQKFNQNDDIFNSVYSFDHCHYFFVQCWLKFRYFVLSALLLLFVILYKLLFTGWHHSKISG